ncbi:MAG: hypothetical protein ACKO7B_14475, partial [Flavobacteriales bacterium]
MSSNLQDLLPEKKKRSFPHKAVWWMNIVAVSGLCLSYLSKYISPETAWWLALFGLGYGTLLLINLVFVGLWIWRKSR